MSALTSLRALLPQFWDARARNGPFILKLSDHHQSNILVDEEWNITCLIDLEFAPVVPIQMVDVPLWLNDQAINTLKGPALEEYKDLHGEFLDVLEQEERNAEHDHEYSQLLRENMRSGGFWYNMALECFSGYSDVFEQHLRSKYFTKFDPDTDAMPLAQLWCENVEGFINAKLNDTESYRKRVHDWYVEAGERDAEEGGM